LMSGSDRMEPKTRILVVAESPALPTGSAEMVRSIFEALTKKYPGAYELCQIGLAHSFAVTYPKWLVHPIMAAKETNSDFQCPPGNRPAREALRNVVLNFQPEIVFALDDPAGVAPLCTATADLPSPNDWWNGFYDNVVPLDPADRPYKLILYLKINGLPLPSQAGSILNRANLIVTMSEWARSGLLSSCPAIPPDKVEVMYSPADTARFVPLLESERLEARRALLPDWMPQDAFVVGWVGLPRWRKQVWLLYKVIHYLRTGSYLVCSDCGRASLFDWDPMARCHLDQRNGVLESRPGYKFDVCAKCQSANVHPAAPLQDVFLWLHMPKDDPLSDWPVNWLEQQYGVEENKDIYYTKGCDAKAALAPDDVPTLYQLWDCLLYLSGGGSFGLPAWEAMCSALPVVYTDYSSHAEFLGAGKAGLAVDGILQPEGKVGLWRSIGDVARAVAAVRRLYYDRQLGRELGSNGRAFVQQYDLDVQAQKWHRIFQQSRLTNSFQQSIEPIIHSQKPTPADRTPDVANINGGV
jgi:glycosyltransferase involved in cell wall biosynthesis